VLVVAASGCGRSDADVTRQRRAFGAATAAVPLPAGARLDTGDVQFDAGCHGLAECADSDETPTTYSVRIELPASAPRDPAGRCGYFMAALRDHGIRLITVWRGTTASYDTDPTLPRWYGDGVLPRWIDVDDQTCATGHVQSAVMVDAGGASPVATAHLVLSLSTSDTAPGPRYLAVAEPLARGEDPAERTVGHLPTGSPPLTRSELAYLRARLDREFVVAASPAADGIDTDANTSARLTAPPGLAALRLHVTCGAGDDALVSLSKVPTQGSAEPIARRTMACTGRPIEIVLPAPAPVLDVYVAVYEHPASASSAPRSVHGPYTVRVAPVLSR
jgi:hypothetical protein